MKHLILLFLVSLICLPAFSQSSQQGSIKSTETNEQITHTTSSEMDSCHSDQKVDDQPMIASGGTVKREDIAKMPTRSAATISKTMIPDNISPIRGCCAPVVMRSYGCCSPVILRSSGCCSSSCSAHHGSGNPANNLKTSQNQLKQLQEGYGQKFNRRDLQAVRAFSFN